jgi:hypothetical protein
MSATTKRRKSVTASKTRGRSGVEAERGPVAPPSRAERYAAGKALRQKVPRDAHAS